MGCTSTWLQVEAGIGELGRYPCAVSLPWGEGGALTIHWGPEQQQQSEDKDGSRTRSHGCRAR